MIKFVKNRFDGKKIKGVEIGVWRGGNAESILQTLNIRKLHLIDPYRFDKEYQEYTIIKRAKEEGITPQQDLDKAEKIAHKTLNPFKYKVRFIKQKSEEAVKEFKDNSLDFVYIDGNHSYEYVKKDIEMWFPKVKKGGIIGGDDFQNGFHKPNSEVVNAVIWFVKEHSLQLYNHGKDWWVIK